ncbi:helix-turn-helix domain-containing protein [Aurantiacibacter spongiae]|nr:helix-turn-helix domain-containing protein [Aurantiacibacter spongiae]
MSAIDSIAIQDAQDHARLLDSNRRMLIALGAAWPCGHLRNPQTTHTIADRAACKVCRRRRWRRGFRIALMRRVARRNASLRAAETRRRGITKLIEEIATHVGHGRVPLDPLLSSVADTFGLSVDDIKSASRRAPAVSARAVIVRILREREISYAVIGRILGGRDHTTVIHAADNWDVYAKRDPRVVRAYLELRDRADAD